MVDEKAHKAVRRNIVRTFTFIEVPEALMGLVADACFAFLADPKEAVGIKSYAMEVLYQLYLKEPGLENELKLLIEENMKYGTAAIQARGRKILKRLGKTV